MHPKRYDTLMREAAGPPPIAYTYADAARAAGVSKTRLGYALAAGELTARKAGRRTIIEADELRRWIASWPVATFRASRARSEAA